MLQQEWNKYQIEKIGHAEYQHSELPKIYFNPKSLPIKQFPFCHPEIRFRDVQQLSIKQQLKKAKVSGNWVAIDFGVVRWGVKAGQFGVDLLKDFGKTVIIKPLFIILIFRRRSKRMEKLQERSPGQLQAEEEDRTKGPWSFEENLLYISFLEKNRAIMSSKRKRRELRIFDRMSAFIRSRNPLQCRSHHQKLLEKMGDFKVIIKNFKKNVGKKYFKQQFRKCMATSPAQLAGPQVKQEQESQQTERVSPSPPLHSALPPNVETVTFPFTEYAFLQAVSQQMMANFVMLPYYFPF